MTENNEELLTDININKLLIAILEEIKEVKIPTIALANTETVEKELVLTYEEEPPSFIISLRNKNEQ